MYMRRYEQFLTDPDPCYRNSKDQQNLKKEIKKYEVKNFDQSLAVYIL